MQARCLCADEKLRHLAERVADEARTPLALAAFMLQTSWNFNFRLEMSLLAYTQSSDKTNTQERLKSARISHSVRRAAAPSLYVYGNCTSNARQTETCQLSRGFVKCVYWNPLCDKVANTASRSEFAASASYFAPGEHFFKCPLDFPFGSRSCTIYPCRSLRYQSSMLLG